MSVEYLNYFLMYWIVCFFILSYAARFFEGDAQIDSATMLIVFIAIAPWLPLLFVTAYIDLRRK